jgi:putative sterol carrier protein
MAEFLSPSWFDEVAAAAAGAQLPAGLALTVEQVITDGPTGELAYSLVVADGRLTVRRGRTPSADVRFTLDADTARAIHEGAQSAQSAFMQGRLRIAGDLRVLVESAAELAAIDDVLAGARA